MRVTTILALCVLSAPALAGGREGDCCNPSGTVNLLQGGLTLPDLFVLAAINRSLHGRNSDEDPVGGPVGSADAGTRAALWPSNVRARAVLRHEASRQAAEAANSVGGGTTTGPGGLRGGGV